MSGSVERKKINMELLLIHERIDKNEENVPYFPFYYFINT